MSRQEEGCVGWGTAELRARMWCERDSEPTSLSLAGGGQRRKRIDRLNKKKRRQPGLPETSRHSQVALCPAPKAVC